MEWMMSIMQEAIDPNFEPTRREESFSKRPSVCVIDCKSAYDNITGSGAPVKDKRTAIDVVIVRESLARVSTTLRWAPTTCQLADGFTKDEARPIDLLRAVIRSG
eukprot:3869404-Pyramimonas_sp.AAC.1